MWLMMRSGPAITTTTNHLSLTHSQEAPLNNHTSTHANKPNKITRVFACSCDMLCSPAHHMQQQ